MENSELTPEQTSELASRLYKAILERDNAITEVEKLKREIERLKEVIKGLY